MKARARILNSASGTERDVSDKVSGLQSFLDSWEQAPDIPQEFRAEAWQNSDEQHKAGQGTPAYRIVYKSLRMIPYPAIELKWPNVRLRILNGDVDYGGMRAVSGMAGRNERHSVIPEFGRVFNFPGEPTYIPCPVVQYDYKAWSETMKAVSYVEIIYIPDRIGDQSVSQLLVRGREGVAPMKAILDLKFGPRLLAIPITEEVGETFSDWHWNRRIHTPGVSAESQANLKALNGAELLDSLASVFNRDQGSDEAARKRRSLASHWYWAADAESDPIMRFVYWWMVVESLEMINNTNVRPVRERLAELFDNDESAWRKIVGKLVGIRSEIVHGNSRNVVADDITDVETLARVLLSARLIGEVSDELRNALLEKVN